MTFAPIPEILEELKAGRPIVLVDDPDRENEGDLCFAAQFATPALVNMMIRECRGWVCLAMSGEMCDQLGLSMQVPENQSRFGTAFTVTVEARDGVTTGISAKDRCTTILTAVRPEATPTDLVRPGHIAPLRARDGGVLVRTGQTEGIVDLCRLAGLRPAGVICEIIKDDGEMARVPDLVAFCQRLRIKMGCIADLVEYRRRRERLIERVAMARMPTRFGYFDSHTYLSKVDGRVHVALTVGIQAPGENGRFPPIEEPVLVRVHSQCLTGDVFGSLRCDWVRSCTRRWRACRRPGAASCSTSARRAAASVSPTSCAPTRCRTAAWTRSRPTRTSASGPTNASSAPVRRSCTTSACAACWCSPTTPRS